MLLVLVPPPSPLATLSILDASLPILDAVLPALNAVLPVLDAAHPVLDDAVPRCRHSSTSRSGLPSRHAPSTRFSTPVSEYLLRPLFIRCWLTSDPLTRRTGQETRAVDTAGATSSTTLANSASVHDVRAARLQGSKCARTSGIQYYHFDASAAHTWRTSCIDLRKALSVNTLQPTNLLARAMSGTTRVCARCRTARLRGSERAVHAHQIEDTVCVICRFLRVTPQLILPASQRLRVVDFLEDSRAPSDPHIPLDPVERCHLFTLYIDSNDTELLPIRCSTLNSIFLGTR
ncbi:hypothetical protein B0H11DRAFT_2191210, partial [Mycena galericulata]